MLAFLQYWPQILWENHLGLYILVFSSFTLIHSKPYLTHDTGLFDADDETTQLIKDLRDRFQPISERIKYLNLTVTQKRRALLRYQEKLRELQELDERQSDVENVHRRTFHSWEIKAIEHGPDLHNHSDQESRWRRGIKIVNFNLCHDSHNHRLHTTAQSAILKLHYTASQSLNSTFNKDNIGDNTFVLVYRRLPGGMRQLVGSTVASTHVTGYIEIDVTSTIQTWVDEPLLNLGFEIETPSESILTNISFTKSSLDAYTYEKTLHSRRVKRRALTENDCRIPGENRKGKKRKNKGVEKKDKKLEQKEEDKMKCCRRPVQIKLKDINLYIEEVHEEDEAFTAYICQGKCSRNHLIVNNWSHVKNYLFKHNKDNKDKKLYRNTCAPYSYKKEFRVHHFDKDGVLTFSEYDDIIVEACGCV